MTSLDHSHVHVLNKQQKNLMCKCKDTFLKKSRIKLGMGQEWFKNQNVNAHYTFLGVHYFS
jgi:hypothetical protein